MTIRAVASGRLIRAARSCCAGGVPDAPTSGMRRSHCSAQHWRHQLLPMLACGAARGDRPNGRSTKLKLKGGGRGAGLAACVFRASRRPETISGGCRHMTLFARHFTNFLVKSASSIVTGGGSPHGLGQASRRHQTSGTSSRPAPAVTFKPCRDQVQSAVGGSNTSTIA